MFLLAIKDWKLWSEVLVGIGGSILWIVAFGLVIASHHAGLTEV
jgi:hypothetical protein